MRKIGSYLFSVSERMMGKNWYRERAASKQLLLMYPGKEGQQKVREYYQKKLQVIFAAILISLLFFFLLLAKGKLDEKTPVREIARNTYAGSERTLSLIADVDGDSYEVEIDVPAKELAPAEQAKYLREAEKKLPIVILGENESLKHVDRKLELVTELPDNPVQIRWYSSDYQLIGTDGSIYPESLSQNGEEVTLYAQLSLGELSKEISLSVFLYEMKRSEKEEMEYAIREAVGLANEKQREEVSLSLPEQVNGKAMTWHKVSQANPVSILLFGALLTILLSLAQSSRVKQMGQERTAQLEADYAEMLNKLVLLLGAGMTVSGSWFRIVKDYEQYGKEKRYVYEEMKITKAELENGVSEAEAYERFGRRCASPQYSKFSALLIQNLRKGNKELLVLFRSEMRDAFEKRKNAARKKGEEAGTKLLAPMFLMLCAVLMIVMIPAFLSMWL